eukprot:2857750-Rhodomonas_salina.1
MVRQLAATAIDTRGLATDVQITLRDHFENNSIEGMKSWWSHNKGTYAVQVVGSTRSLIFDYLKANNWNDNARNVVENFKNNTHDHSAQWAQIWNGFGTLYQNHSKDTVQSYLSGNSTGYYVWWSRFDAGAETPIAGNRTVFAIAIAISAYARRAMM